MGRPQKDLTNQKFGELTVLRYLDGGYWECQCSCGNITTVKTASLNSGKTKSCGCLRGKNTINNTRNYGPKEDLTGKTFHYLTPLYYIKGGSWYCKCKCGKELIVDTRNLKSGHTKSCGCYNKEINSILHTTDMTNFENENFKVLQRKGSDSQGVALWECQCKKCGNIFVTRGSNIRNNIITSCGCVHSLNEKKIIELLTDNNIEFSTQYTFPDLLGLKGKPLRFDFAIFEKGQLKHLIEYNGKQHYVQAEGSWGEEYESLVEHDNRKKEYCKKHNIPLKIIKYDQLYKLKDLI